MSGENGLGSRTCIAPCACWLRRHKELSALLWLTRAVEGPPSGKTRIHQSCRAPRGAPICGAAHDPSITSPLGLATEDLSYCIDLGDPISGQSGFDFDPEIKCDCMWTGQLRPASTGVDCHGPIVRLRQGDGGLLATLGQQTTWELAGSKSQTCVSLAS